jgi:putative holliday junction resolvase
MNGKPRILGLDVGDKRIGIAISDPLRITSAGLEVIQRKNTPTDVQAVAQIAESHGAVQLVLGLPLNMDGTSGEQAEKVRSFGKKLARATGLPIVYEDERLSTVTAIHTLTLQGVKTGHNRDLVDMQSAAIILQTFLDRNESPSSA